MGGGHACALGVTGELWCWGDNAAGQLGDGTTDTRQTPAPVAGLVAAQQASAGARHTCAVDANRATWCWGAVGGAADDPDAGCPGGAACTPFPRLFSP